MKHTIKGIHGHLYKLTMRGPSIEESTWTKVCVSAKDAFKNDYLIEEIRIRQGLSKKYKVCWSCNEPTDRPGGYSDPDLTKVLYYECEECYPPNKKKRKDGRGV